MPAGREPWWLGAVQGAAGGRPLCCRGRQGWSQLRPQACAPARGPRLLPRPPQRLPAESANHSLSARPRELEALMFLFLPPEEKPSVRSAHPASYLLPCFGGPAVGAQRCLWAGAQGANRSWAAVLPAQPVLWGAAATSAHTQAPLPAGLSCPQHWEDSGILEDCSRPSLTCSCLPLLNPVFPGLPHLKDCVCAQQGGTRPPPASPPRAGITQAPGTGHSQCLRCCVVGRGAGRPWKAPHAFSEKPVNDIPS